MNNKKKNAPIWKFLNSAFFIWFISSIVIGGFVSYRDNVNYEHTQQHLQKKLDTEIAARINPFRSYLKKLETEGTPLNVKDVIRETGPVRDQPYPMGAFSEYKEFTLESLLWELSLAICEDCRKEQEQIYNALHSVRRIKQIGSEITVQTPLARKKEYIDRIYKELDQYFNVGRWHIPMGRT